MKTMSRVTAPTEKGKPLTGVNAPELGQKRILLFVAAQG